MKPFALIVTIAGFAVLAVKARQAIIADAKIEAAIELDWDCA